MTTAQKIIKYLAIALAVGIIMSIISGIIFGISIFAGIVSYKNETSMTTTVISPEEGKITTEFSTVTNEVNNTTVSNIYDLDIELRYAELAIKKGDRLKTETNNSDIICKEENGQLKIKEKEHNIFTNTKENNKLIVYVPENYTFGKVDIEAGAGQVEIDELNTRDLSLEIGAGTVSIGKLNVTGEADIEGGAGTTKILAGEVNNLNLDMGAGKVELKAKLTGRNEIDAGVGKLDIELTDGVENYSINVNKGIGTVNIAGNTVRNNEMYGSGSTLILVEGGIGSIDIK